MNESSPRPDVDEGGDAPCWADQVCAECGVVAGEVHRDGCSQAEADRPRD